MKMGLGNIARLKTIQRKIDESANKELDKFNNKEIILLGTNKQPNKDDRMKNEIEIYPFNCFKNPLDFSISLNICNAFSAS